MHCHLYGVDEADLNETNLTIIIFHFNKLPVKSNKSKVTLFHYHFNSAYEECQPGTTKSQRSTFF